MDFLIIGLGNPGTEYELTRHNIGFLVLDALAEKAGSDLAVAKFGKTAKIRVKNKQALLLKPDTFMNLSGKAVRYWMNELKLPQQNIIVITDDLALPTGKLRLKTKGSDGGHNGLKSINEFLSSQDYARLRFGVGNEFAKGKQVDYVLGRWDNEEWPIVKEKIPVAVEAIHAYILEGPDRAMEKYNRG